MAAEPVLGLRGCGRRFCNAYGDFGLIIQRTGVSVPELRASYLKGVVLELSFYDTKPPMLLTSFGAEHPVFSPVSTRS